jgi:predicted signal transduction protein with EAL and GGDEF domain
VAQRLRTCIRESDTLARLGGDEFVVLLEGLSEDGTQAAIQARGVVEKALQVINQPYWIKDIEQHSTSSIGVSMFSNSGQKLEDLLKQADTAMYAAKKAGRNTLRFFDPAMQETLELRSQLEAGMRKAIQNDEFLLLYQVQVDSDQRNVGAEALIRWEHPVQGRISPGQFIPVAEETGLILPVGLWVRRQPEATRNGTRSAHRDSRLLSTSVRQFRQSGFVRQVVK